MILKHLDVGMFGHGGQQGPFDLAARHILGVKDAPLGVPALAAQIQFAQAVDLALGELHPQLHQFGDARRPLLDDGSHDVLMAQPGARLQRVADVVIEANPPCW